MAFFITERIIPSHIAKALDTCQMHMERACDLDYNGDGCPDSEVCVQVDAEYSVRRPTGNWYTFEPFHGHHLCAPCYRAVFGTE